MNSTLEKGNYNLNIKEVDIHDTLNKVIDKFQIIIDEREGKITKKFEASNSFRMNFDNLGTIETGRFFERDL